MGIFLVFSYSAHLYAACGLCPLPLLFSLGALPEQSQAVLELPPARQTPSSSDTFLTNSSLPFSAASYCQHYPSNANLKAKSPAVLFQQFAIISKIRATHSSNMRFYMIWPFSSLTIHLPYNTVMVASLLSAAQCLHYFVSNGFLICQIESYMYCKTQLK